MLFTIKILGWLLARMPILFAEYFALVIGNILFALPIKRKQTLSSNLHHAFPDKSETWRKTVALESCRRTVEMGMLVLALPYLNLKQLQERIRIPRETKGIINQWLKGDQPVVLLVPHFTLFEYLPMLPALFGLTEVNAGAIFRPLRNKKTDAWIRQTREKFGLKLLSRKEGFSKAKEILGSNGILGILFDQNAGRSGTIMSFFNRVASTTDLPSIMAQRFKAETYIFHPHRDRFWNATILLHRLKSETSEISQSANDWLEGQLSKSPDSCSDWLWMHGRWNTANHPTKRFQLSHHKKIQIPTNRYVKGYRLWIRMPNWLGDVVMSLPLLRALGEARPDAEITLIAQPAYIELLKNLGIGDAYKEIPPKKEVGYFEVFKSWKEEYPDTQLLLTNSTRADLEAKYIGAPQRFGLVLPGKPRPFLTHGYKPHSEIINQLNSLHQTRLWENMFRYFGLQIEISMAPFQIEGINPQPEKIGFIAGSSNNPEKCWPPEKWIQLASQILEAQPVAQIHLYGTKADCFITRKIKNKLPMDQVFDHAGKTNLQELASELASCAQVIGNDTGGIHLANATGAPVTVLYGPTNALVTSPIFEGKKNIVQPSDCPVNGGKSIHALEVPQVIQSLP
ncbi:MAG: hypothetical protein HOK49_15750 [Opitutae bacterium]|nr:hypothetical protein [Opitutae bacterium]MBT6959328.1 hypothetical protein [Opitutae bacterium]